MYHGFAKPSQNSKLRHSWSAVPPNEGLGIDACPGMFMCTLRLARQGASCSWWPGSTVCTLTPSASHSQVAARQGAVWVGCFTSSCTGTRQCCSYSTGLLHVYPSLLMVRAAVLPCACVVDFSCGAAVALWRRPPSIQAPDSAELLRDIATTLVTRTRTFFRITAVQVQRR